MAETKEKLKKEEEEKKPRRRVKKSKGHGGHHGGAWKVAYADFVTAMMALFLVLWLVSQADMKVKEAIAQYFRSPGVFDTQKGGILEGAKKVSKAPEDLTSQTDEQALMSLGENLRKKFETRPEFSKYKDQIKIEVTDEGLRIQILDKAERVSFPVGSAELNDEAKAVLNEIAQGICTLPNPLKIGGHTDSRVFPSENGYTNWELSADRANAARRALQNGCVKAEQVQRIIGYADTDPIDPADPLAPANRRISITVMRLKTDAANQENTERQTDVKKSASIVETKTDRKAETKTSEKAETKTLETDAKMKLSKEGKVVVGEPDEIPTAPKISEGKSQ